MDAQRDAVTRYGTAHLGTVIAKFTEAEPGKRGRDRPELQQTLDLCRKRGATLVIAKLRRLARNVPFISAESNVNFVAVDQTTKDRFAAKRRSVEIGATARVATGRMGAACEGRVTNHRK